MNYPREDKCLKCGQHIGWIMSEIGEMFALELCEECEEKEKEEEDT